MVQRDYAQSSQLDSRWFRHRNFGSICDKGNNFVFFMLKSGMVLEERKKDLVGMT
jgi:hypothetical protein